MRKLKKSRVVLFITVTVMLWQSIISVNAFRATDINLDVLYPEYLRAQVNFESGFTDSVLTALKEQPSAQALYTLNVLRGSNGDLMLDRTANRMEGATMLVRLLGQEEEALHEKYSHPFTDVAQWASPYVGYLYQKGLTKGIGNNLFGSQDAMNEKSYLTFLLRALGYSDIDGKDFTWENVEQVALKKDLLTANEKVNGDKPFVRERLSVLSWRAMFLEHQRDNIPLIVVLHREGLISTENICRVLSGAHNTLLQQWMAMLPILEEGFLKHQIDVPLRVSKEMFDNNSSNYLDIVLERVQTKTGVFRDGYSLMRVQYGEEYTITVRPKYANSLEEQQTLFNWADQIASTIVQPEMSDYEKVKAIHDYLVLTLQYDTTADLANIPDSSYHAYGALLTKKAVCNAYAELMLLLCKNVGIPCRIVTGTAGGQNHAWNIVYLDGETYQIDVTWDDPVTNKESGILSYNYFNITDAQMRLDHTWNQDNYPVSTATALNYFVVNGFVINSKEQLHTALKKAISSNTAECTFKLQDFHLSYEDIHSMVIDVNEQAGYRVRSYVSSLNKEQQVIQLEFEYAN